ncbi:MAG: glucose-6-phosphate isomerase [Bacteroidales bacterium]|jgi:glucose-6-phosphate isomerase|nr:glucose-6-phosphate isomerase [Bacteroidales bacterium]MDI9591744.1 glucose-6-phosphate isomerase [Bacteroidota bacterium]HOF80141.1 glucose-6-phosphate isomerase [Bacteroidales bacterium]HOR75461.1 glucose-6-phosphate isomerase [Bacteroidales bacterium]HPL10872.1 glucose-6-phosphate isomerase [Bacteroidales bacterium]
MVTVNISNIFDFVDKQRVLSFQKIISKNHQALLEKTGAGNNFLGWLTLPHDIDDALLRDIDSTAVRIRELADVFVVVGIGGSYLGARAIIEALKHNFNQLLQTKGAKNPIILYAGQNLSEDYLADLFDVLDRYDYAINVISKSGTTTEPAVAFRILKNHIEKKYGNRARERIIVTTDSSKGALRKMANDLGYKSYIVPGDIGGRYSVLTPVGLLPIAVGGFDIKALVNGAKKMQLQLAETTDIKRNPAALYAASRNALYMQGKFIEIMVNYQPNLSFFAEWWKQLYGESEGKEGKGIFPASVINTTDLHSMGQYIQDGERKIFETVLSVGKSKRKLLIPAEKEDLDQLNYIAGKNIHYVNQMAERGTTLAHLDGGVPCIEISIDKVDEYHLGGLIYFFEFACALSGYTLGVNPFDQPGVEAYKRNMFALLGKPGFEKESMEIQKRLKK